jgi:hypothetical protein
MWCIAFLFVVWEQRFKRCFKAELAGAGTGMHGGRRAASIAAMLQLGIGEALIVSQLLAVYWVMGEHPAIKICI